MKKEETKEVSKPKVKMTTSDNVSSEIFDCLIPRKDDMWFNANVVAVYLFIGLIILAGIIS